jgi:PAS domain S-box-containing protein
MPKKDRRRNPPTPGVRQPDSDDGVPLENTWDAFLQSPERYRIGFENSPAGIAIVAPSGRFMMVNPAYSEIFGYSREEFLRCDFLALTHPDDKKLSQDAMAEVIAARGKSVRFSKRYVHRDGHTIWADVKSELMYDAKGNPAYFITHVMDVTERTLAERALFEEKEKLGVTLRCIGDGVITTDTGGRIVIMNQAAETLTGWTQRETAGMPLSSVFVIQNELTGQAAANPVQRVLQTGGIVDLENHTVLVSRNGTRLVIADSGSPIKDAKGAIIGVVLVFRDITEKTRFLESAERSQRLESLGVLAGGIAHDFNNLLGVIYGNVELAHEASTSLEVNGFLDVTLNTLLRARGLAQQLLTFSKSGMPIRRTNTLGPFVQETVQFARSGSSVAVSFDIPADLWLCSFDATQIGQVIDNIVINALQAMPSGGTLSVSAANVTFAERGHPTLATGRYVRVSIRDSGTGIPREILGKVFDPFFTTKEKGSGLGLSIAFSVVSRHGGTIEVESAAGLGTSFHIFLPAADEAAVPDPAPTLALSRGKGRILLMDDEEQIRTVVATMLRRIGYEVDCVSEGGEALRVLAARSAAGAPFDAVVLDLTVQGGMGGEEAVARIRQMGSSVPVIVASGYADGPMLSDPARYGFTAGIAKPFRFAELSQLLGRFTPQGTRNEPGR